MTAVRGRDEDANGLSWVEPYDRAYSQPFGGTIHTVVARFHHPNRELATVEEDLVAHGADDARITGYIVAMTLDAESHLEAVHTAKRILDNIGASRIKITKHRAKRPVA